MDKSGIENPLMSEVIGRCDGMKKRMTTQNRQKSNAKNIKKCSVDYERTSLYIARHD